METKVPKIVMFSVIEDDKGEFYIVDSLDIPSKNVTLKLLSDAVYENSKFDKDSDEFNELYLKQVERSEKANSFNSMKHLELQGYKIKFL